ncbi:MAG: hypothetical protein M0C28_22970 [Candidatus Moduliflexus flocculans]|nr:hypothetical protein [Candidatus Moduliflexus flocculans]
MDLGGTLASTINVHTYRRLMARLGFGEEPAVAFVSRRSSSVLPDERLLRHLDVDCRAVILGSPDVNPERELPDGSLSDEWQTLWKHVGEGQHFINVAWAVRRARSPTRRWSKHSRGRTRSIPAASARCAARPRRCGRPRTRPSSWCSGVGAVHQIQFMRGYAAALEDLLAAPDFVQAFLERYADFWTCMTERALEDGRRPGGSDHVRGRPGDAAGAGDEPGALPAADQAYARPHGAGDQEVRQAGAAA